MSIYEAIGIGWVIFTSTLSTILIIYLAYLNARRLWALIKPPAILHDLSPQEYAEIVAAEDRLRTRQNPFVR